ncbi:alkaline phosphatase family protein [Roseimaritima sediminicola]|uniref:alkaline phosphatase family protein n=1 Tax=Roseimaritima sediminicola TaxID=2662066 RepID=UPI001F3839D6|nr:alkaline phosphatase family protein [Roseimaritima sediminicola]
MLVPMRFSTPGVSSARLLLSSIRCLLAAACLALCLTSSPAPAQQPAAAATDREPTPKVLLIGIDGFRVDAFQAAHTPHLDALAEDGIIDLQTSVISEDVRQSDTISGPGWTTFLSGVWADRHGVVDNTFKGRDRERGPHVFTLVKQQRPELQTASFLDWTPLGDHVVRDADLNVIATPNKAVNEYVGMDRSLATMAAATLRERPVDFVFVYYGACDETGHRHGFHPSVKPYTRQIEITDELIGQLLDAIEQRSSRDSEDWLVVVSSDHGGEGLGHGGGRDNPQINRVPMIVSGPAAARGTDVARPTATTDIVAVALTHLGIDINPDWHLAGSAAGWLRTTKETSGR